MKMRTILSIITAAFAASFAVAQDQGPISGPPSQPPQGQVSQADVPGRAARLSLVTGTVSFQPGSVEDWVPATPNRPLTTGDRLWTEAGARAEVHLGSAAMRLSGRTNFSFINLDDRTAQVQLSLGTLSVRVRRLADDEMIEVDTPQVALSLLRPGEYRIDVNEQGDTSIVTVRSGQAEANAGQAFTIQPRQQVRIMTAGEAAPSNAGPAAGQDAGPIAVQNAAPTFDQRDAPPADAFDVWCQDRDRREDLSQSSRYVSRDTPGYADLDAAGTWRNDPTYGNVWTPAGMGPDWAPYRTGHWAWIAPWGWTWVDDAPWGYAPFHYGRWVYIGGAWAWVPGPVVVTARPVYAPALVAWVGGPSFGVSIGIGGGAAVGWFALGPREVFVPAYAYSPAYIERVNVTNTVIVNRAVFTNVSVANATYVNRGVVGAVVAVPGAAFVAGRPVAAAAVMVRPEAVARVQVAAYAGVAPQREAVLGGRAVTTVAPPAAAMNRTVVTRVAPPPAPVPFARQQQALQANQGRPLAPAAYNQIRQSSPPPQRVNYRPATPAGTPAAAARPISPTPAARPVSPATAARPDLENRTPNAPAAPAARPSSPTLERAPAPASRAAEASTAAKPAESTRPLTRQERERQERAKKKAEKDKNTKP
jgi:hypothetical protein